MKKNYSLTIALLAVFILLNQFQTFAQKKVRGNGNVTSIEHQVKSFSTLEIDGVFNVLIKQGEKESVTVETDENLHEYISIESNGNTLNVSTRKRITFRKKNRMNIYITIKDIGKLKLSGVGNVETEGTLRLSELDLRIKCVGNVTLKLEVDDLDARINSVGNIALSGKANNAEIDNSSVGNLNAFDLKNEVLDLKNSGVGRVEVYASKELAIKSSGVGNVYYKGDAVITDLNIRGVGKVKKK